MRNKLLFHWNIALLVVAFSQCDRCKPNSVEDITNWSFCWDDAASLDSSFPGLGTKRYIVCHVPSEDAVYLLLDNGGCYKLTQASGLRYEPIASLPSVTGAKSFFAFPAGSIQEQTLHVGVVSKQQVTLYQYQEGTWKLVRSHHVGSIAAWSSSSRAVACSIHEVDQCNGLIVLMPNAQIPPVVLCYDASKNTLEPSGTWRYTSAALLQSAIAIAPSVLLVSEESAGTVSCWAEKGNTYEHVQVPAHTYHYPISKTSLFLLHAKKWMPQAVCARFIEKHGKKELRFYTMTCTRPYAMQPIDDLPEVLKSDEDKEVDNGIDYTGSLILPFHEVVYVVTKDKDGLPVYYKGNFRSSK